MGAILGERTVENGIQGYNVLHNQAVRFMPSASGGENETTTRFTNLVIEPRAEPITTSWVNPKFYPIFPEILRLVGYGENGSFTLLPDIQKVGTGNPYSRSFFATHNQAPGQIFAISAGLIKSADDGSINLSLPKINETLGQYMPHMGAVTLDLDGMVQDLRIDSVWGGYNYPRLASKVRATQMIEKIFADHPLILVPKVVCYGKFNNLVTPNGDDVGWFIYSKPKGRSLTDMIDEQLRLNSHLDSFDDFLKDQIVPRLSKIFTALQVFKEHQIVHLQLHLGNWEFVDNGNKILFNDWDVIPGLVTPHETAYQYDAAMVWSGAMALLYSGYYEIALKNHIDIPTTMDRFFTFVVATLVDMMNTHNPKDLSNVLNISPNILKYIVNEFGHADIGDKLVKFRNFLHYLYIEFDNELAKK